MKFDACFKCYCHANIVFKHLEYHTVVCISLEMHSVAKQVSVSVGWVKIKTSLMAQLKGLTAKFKLM